MSKFLSTIYFLFYFVISFAQPKREHRGAWIATYSNIDWPSSNSISATTQQAELISILNKHKQAGINAIYLQVRSQCDALYQSSLEPSAALLTGSQGSVLSYDPLQFAITEARKRGMEIHAWFNPYRAAANGNATTSFSAQHLINSQPSWILNYGILRVLNPGLPAVQNHVLKVVADVLRRYDVDGIHYDDYFYPYPQASNIPFYNDTPTFQTYGLSFPNINDWRRANIDTLVKRTYDSVKMIKPWVKFGISPFGIWQNLNASQPLGSATNGLQSYSAQYANSRLWIAQNWVDYLTPQMYWSLGFSAANYDVLAPWWQNNSYGRHIYSGNAIYKINNDADVNWANPTQIPNQIKLNRTYTNITGSCFYNTKTFNLNPQGVRDSMINNYFKAPSLQPLMPWRDNVLPVAPSSITNTIFNNHVTINWIKPPTTLNELDKIRQFIVYRSNSPTIDIAFTNNIKIITSNDTIKFTDSFVNVGTWYYTVTSIDRFNNESIVANTTTAIVSPTLINQPNTYVDVLKYGPNPFDNKFNVQLLVKQSAEVKMQLVDAFGRVLQQQNFGKLQKGIQILDINTNSIINKGNYIFIVTIANTKQVIKVSKF